MSGEGLQLKISGSTFKIEFLQLFASVLKSVAHVVVAAKTGGLSLGLAPNAVSGFFGVLKSFKRDETLEQKAWLLVSGGLLFAIEKILADIAKPDGIQVEALEQFSSDLAKRISTRSYTIEPDFFFSAK